MVNYAGNEAKGAEQIVTEDYRDRAVDALSPFKPIVGEMPVTSTRLSQAARSSAYRHGSMSW